MSGRNYLVDINVLIQLGNGDEVITDFLQEKIVFLSFISEMELLSKNSCVLVEFNHEIKSEAIKLRRLHRLKLPDAIVAASAKYLRLPLLTADKDFQKISGLELLFIDL